MNVALLYLPYLPNLFWFSNYLNNESILIEHEEKFVKSSFRNRCVIAGANGVQVLSIPLTGGRDHAQFYKEVRISHHYNWGKKHWQSIRSAYGSAPYFEHYADKFLPLFEKHFEYLFDFNLALLEVLLRSLKMNKHFDFTSTYEKSNLELMDLRLIKSADEEINLLRYYQVFENKNGFIPNLSIIDAVFNLGPETKNYLLTHNQ